MATTIAGSRGHAIHRVKNKNPSKVQITAEQLLREARELNEPRPPCRGIADADELSYYCLRKRQEFEALVRRRRAGASTSSYAWARYAAWEESQRDMPRARSVFERALLEDAGDPALWAGYAEFEAHNGRLGRARAVLDRAVAALPSADDLWRKRAETEEALGCGVAGARVVFERWTARTPRAAAWEAYADLEARRARAVYERLVRERPGSADAFLQYAEFEARQYGGEASAARAVYERAVDAVDLTEDDDAERLLLSFAGFEENRLALHRARAVYALGLDRLPEARADELRRRFLAFERRFGGDAAAVDGPVFTAKRRARYEAAVAADPLYQLAMDQLPAVLVQGALFPRRKEQDDVPGEQSSKMAPKTTRPGLKILEAAYLWKLQKRVQLAIDQQPAVDVQGAFPPKEEDVPLEQSKMTAKRKRPDLEILEAACQWKLQKTCPRS